MNPLALSGSGEALTQHPEEQQLACSPTPSRERLGGGHFFPLPSVLSSKGKPWTVPCAH